jgi:hypothetical protein
LWGNRTGNSIQWVHQSCSCKRQGWRTVP